MNPSSPRTAEVVNWYAGILSAVLAAVSVGLAIYQLPSASSTSPYSSAACNGTLESAIRSGSHVMGAARNLLTDILLFMVQLGIGFCVVWLMFSLIAAAVRRSE